MEVSLSREVMMSPVVQRSLRFKTTVEPQNEDQFPD